MCIPTTIIARFGEFAQCSLHSMECVNKEWRRASEIAYKALVLSSRENPYLANIVARFTTTTNAKYAQIAKSTRREVLERASVFGITVPSHTGVRLQDLMTQVMTVVETRDFLTFFEVLRKDIPLDKRPALAEITGKTDIESVELRRKWMHINQTVLKNIQVLQLNHLKLHVLPPEIGLLVNLRSLSLNKNQLCALPVEMGTLIALKTLVLTHNQLRKPPIQIKRLAKTLHEIYLSGNYMSYLPAFLFPIPKTDLPKRIPTIAVAKIAEFAWDSRPRMELVSKQWKRASDMAYRSFIKLHPFPTPAITFRRSLHPFPNMPDVIIALFGEFVECSLDSMVSVNKQWKRASYITYRTLLVQYKKDPLLAQIVADFTPRGELSGAQCIQIVKNTKREVLARVSLVSITDIKDKGIQVLMAEISPLMTDVETKSFLIFFEVLRKNIPVRKRPALAEITGKTDIESVELRRNWMHANPTILNDIRGFVIKHAELSVLPREIGLLNNLLRLEITNTNIQRIPPQIGNLLALQTLDISYNRLLQEIPSQIGNLLALKALELDCNQLRKIPSRIGDLLALERLDINYNKLQEIPSQIGNLLALQTLSLKGNKLREIPPQIGNLLALKELRVRENALREIPPQIGNLLALKALELGWNLLRKIPPQIGNLLALEMLDINYNKLQEIPSQIGNLLALQTLSLKHNKLREIPFEIANLPALKMLDIRENKVQYISYKKLIIKS